MNDNELKGAFRSLEAHDRASAPSFAHTMAGASRKTRRRAAWVAGTSIATAMLIAAAALLIVRASAVRPELSLPPALRAAREPLGFLRAPPSLSVLASARPFDSTEEGW
ncbi:MAG: hypothetical protein IT378_15440 [Sandaracinaceae bacterium]|nr:hypothetical protein [Sandaracinaceae bacterium]